MEMESRVMKMESEMRVLRAAMAQVPQNVLRELTARGALLVVQASTAELEDVVAKALEEDDADEEKGPAVVEMEEEEEQEEEGKQGDVEATKAVLCGAVEATVVEESESKGPEDMDVSSDDSSDEDESDESSDSDAEEAEPQEDQVERCEEAETSQESATSGPVVEQAEETPLSLSAFDKASTKPASPVAAAPQRPPVPFALPSQTSAPIRPLVLARRPATTESAPPPATPKATPVLPSVPVPSKTSSVALDLPAHFEVQTKDSVPVAWEKWCCGDAFRGFPPLRLVTSKQVVNKAVLRRLSDLRCAMLPIETLAKENNLWSEHLTPHEAGLVFKQLAPLLPLSQVLPSGRERKKEIAWSTALNLMRRGKKRKQQLPASDNDGFITETLI